MSSAVSQSSPEPSGASVLGISVIAALAGFIFGFDTVVISGANQPIKELWHTTEISPWFHGFFIMSMALWGTVAGALFGGVPTDRYGRRRVLLWIGILFTVSSVGSALAPDPYSFSFFRFLGGLGIGISSVAAPAYVSEISTPSMRGRLVAMYQFNIVFGILLAFLSNYLLKGVGGADDWRWMLGVMALPSVVYTALVVTIPESPRWLIAARGDEAGARRVFEGLGVTDAQSVIDTVKRNIASEAGSASAGDFFQPRHGRVIRLAFWIAFFNQLSGINFILYYAPEILERAGLASADSLRNSIFIGGANLAFTFVGLWLIDRIGRRTLMFIGSLGYILSLSMVAYAFKAAAGPGFLLTFLLLFIASHAVGQGAVIWVFLSEIFPNRIRARGQAFGASTHWVFAALITLVTPVFLDKDNGLLRDNPWPIFAFLAGMMVLQLAWTLTRMPETKGVPLEELEERLAG
jgi:sugar porter (SP) family MFS transporter